MTVPTITPRRLEELRSAGQAVDLIDVRTPVEFREVHVPFARNVPLDRLDPAAARAANAPPRPASRCTSSASRAAAARRRARGSSRPGVNVVNVEGGTQAWADAGLPVVRGKKAISLERQVRIAAGSLVLLGAVLGWLVHPGFVGLSAFVGAGLVFSGVTDTCGMGLLLARMPWNRVAARRGGACATTEAARETRHRRRGGGRGVGRGPRTPAGRGRRDRPVRTRAGRVVRQLRPPVPRRRGHPRPQQAPRRHPEAAPRAVPARRADPLVGRDDRPGGEDRHASATSRPGGSTPSGTTSSSWPPVPPRCGPTIPGIDLPNVFTLRTLDDTDRIKAAVDAGVRRAVIVGGGFIGLELAENFVHRGIDTTVVERNPQILTPFDPEMTTPLAARLRGEGRAPRPGRHHRGHRHGRGRPVGAR